MASRKSGSILFLWSLLITFLMMVAMTIWWFNRNIQAIDHKIETIEKK